MARSTLSKNTVAGDSSMKAMIFFGRIERVFEAVDFITNGFDYQYHGNDFCIGHILAPEIMIIIKVICDVWHEHNVAVN